MKTMLKQGHMAKVYIDNESAYKIYDDFYPEEWVDKEVYIHDILREKTSLNITEMEKMGAHEIKMPYLGKTSLDVSLFEKHDEEKLYDFVHIQSEIHNYQSLELENAHVVYRRWIEMSQLSRDIKEIASDVLKKIEYKNNLCHLDYQPSHVVKHHDKYFVMDWIHAKLANPILDIAQTYIILRLNSYELAQKYLYKVIELNDIKKDDVYHAVPLMAAIKMIETDDIYEHKVLTTMIYNPKNKDVTK